MPDSPEPNWRERLRRVDGLLQEIDHFKDPQSRTQTRVIVQTHMDLHGAALEKILGRIAATGAGGLAMIDELARDDLISSLLLLYGLHPLDLETRVRQGLADARPTLQTHGGGVELLSIDAGVVRLRFSSAGDGPPPLALTLKQAIEAAIYEKAPEVVSIELEGLAPNIHEGIALPILAAT